VLVEENIFVFKMHLAIRGVVNFYTSGVVFRDRRIGSWVVVNILLGLAPDPPMNVDDFGVVSGTGLPDFS
jgi:hypothetical protein